MHKIRQNERYGGLIQGVELLLILYARLGFALFELKEPQFFELCKVTKNQYFTKFLQGSK